MTIDLKQLEIELNLPEDHKSYGIIEEAARAYLAQQKAPEQDVVLEAFAAIQKELSLGLGDDGRPEFKPDIHSALACIYRALTQRPAAPLDQHDIDTIHQLADDRSQNVEHSGGTR